MLHQRQRKPVRAPVRRQYRRARRAYGSVRLRLDGARDDDGGDTALAGARRRGVLVLSPPTGSGQVLPQTRLREYKRIVAGNRRPQKASALMLALTVSDDIGLIHSACSTTTRRKPVG